MPQNLPFLRESLFSVGFRAVSALAVGKTIAVAFGPAGTALFGQAMNLYAALFNLPADALARAMVREGAAAHQEGREDGAKASALTSSLLILLLFAVQAAVSAGIAFYTDWFEPFQSGHGILVFLLAFGLLSAASFSASYFLIWSRTRFQAESASCMSLGGLLGLGLAWFAGLGFFSSLLGFFLGQAIGSLALLLYRQAEIPFFFHLNNQNLALARKLLVFALAVGASGIINQVSLYALVHWALEHLGADAVGKWMAMNRLADAVNVPILAVANSILLPALAGLAANRAGLKEFLRPIFRQSLFWLVPVILLLWWSYPFLLRVLFSREFVADPALLPWQMAGDFFKSSTAVFAVLMLALGHTRFYFWLESASALLVLAGSVLLFPRFGFACLFITHAIRYALYWLAIVLRYRSLFF